MRTKLILFFLIASPLLASAQEGFKGVPFIEVTGTAETEIEPNEIYTIIRIREFEENRQKVALEKLDADFLKALKEAGIDRKRLELADAGSQLDRFRRRDKDAFRQKTYQLKLTSAAELERFLAALEAVKVDMVDIARLHHTDYEKIKMDLKTKALQAARAKAEALLKAVGSELGKPLIVREWDVHPVDEMPQMRANMMMKSEFDAAQQEPSIGFRKIKLMAQVAAQFEIK